MILNSSKRKVLLFILSFLLFFSAYLLTLSGNMEQDGDFLQVPMEVEGLTSYHFRTMAHIAWVPFGKLAFNAAHFMGYRGGSVGPIEVFNTLIAALGLALFSILIYELTGSLLISVCLSAFIAFSYTLWLHTVHTKFYSGSFLFIVLSFYLYTKKDIKSKPFLFALANAFAVFFHLTNIGIAFCSIIYFLSGPEKIREKIKRTFLYGLFLFLIILAGYILAYIISPFGPVGSSLGVGISVPFLVLYYFGTLLFLPSSFIKGVMWYAVYLGLFIYLIVISYKNIFKDRLLHLCLVFGFLLTLIMKLTAPMNANYANILIVLNIVLALMLKDFKGFSPVKKAAVGIILVFLAALLFVENFRIFYTSKDISNDRIYQVVVEKPGNLFSHGDAVYANGVIPYYLAYYLRCKVFIIPGYNTEEEYNEMVDDINSSIDSGRKVKLFFDRSEMKIMQGVYVLDVDRMIQILSKDYNLKRLYESRETAPGLRETVLYEVKRQQIRKRNPLSF